ncbi:MAG: hypothetical protein S4CHLAM102_10470 [Chlamydiia bacterium]|nr:hypothetical protein [Chlamydiia bacterium]
MGLFKSVSLTLLTLISPLTPLFADITPADDQVGFDRGRILFYTSHKQITRAIDEYLACFDKAGFHQFDLLQEIAIRLLEEGVQSVDHEKQLLALYGIGVSKAPSSFELLESAIHSSHPYVQAVGLQLASSMFDDRVDDVIKIGLHSKYLMIRLETLYHLAQRKAKSTLGNIDSLLSRLPPEMHVFFPDLLATYGTPESINAIKKMFNSDVIEVRIAAILSSMKFQIDELLPSIRASITHPSPEEQETCAAAVGFLRDLGSVESLKKLSQSPIFEVRMAALRSLYALGYPEYENALLQNISEANLFSIGILADLPKGDEILRRYVRSTDLHVRINSALALLAKKDPACFAAISEILFIQERQAGLVPYHTVGHTFMAWKTFPFGGAKAEMRESIEAMTNHVQQQVLAQCIDLPENLFLQLAGRILETKGSPLIPTTIRLLEHLHSDKAIALLKTKTQEMGCPLIRAYCNLCLYRMNVEGPYRENFLKWIASSKDADLIRFQPMLDRKSKPDGEATPYQLSPEQTSALLIESFETLAQKHEEQSITHLLKTMRDGNEKNRYALAGLLIKATQ